jgi:molecular chaperone DnaK
MSDKTYGIDLGTTYSCIAEVDEYGKPVIIKNFEGKNTTPSVVLFEDDERIVGETAKSGAVMNTHSLVDMIKREMGNTQFGFDYGGV